MTVLSTYEVASMMQVTETTVKRWADEGILPCSRTPGGHRKFAMNDIVEFAETKGYLLHGVQMPHITSDQMELLQFGVATKSYNKISNVVLDAALRADSAGVLQLLHFLNKNHISLTSITDEVLRPALVRIGEMWQEGALTIDHEHRASNAIAEALVRFAPEIHHKKKNGLRVVCACAEGEQHEIGLRSLSYVLESEGWTAYFTGANTPFDSLQSLIQSIKPNAVCLSFTVANKGDEFFARMKQLASAIHKENAQFIVGGFYAGNYTNADFDSDCIAGSTTDALAYLKEAFNLKPGKKKESTVTMYYYERQTPQ